MKTRTKIILAIPLAFVAYEAIDYSVQQHRIAQIEKKTYTDQLAFYATFLKPGMTRIGVEQELAKRSIPFVQRFDKPAYQELVLLERFGSPAWYCSFEDASALLEFSADDSASNREFSERNPYTANPDDRLRKISVYRQLTDCL